MGRGLVSTFVHKGPLWGSRAGEREWATDRGPALLGLPLAGAELQESKKSKLETDFL